MRLRLTNRYGRHAQAHDCGCGECADCRGSDSEAGALSHYLQQLAKVEERATAAGISDMVERVGRCQAMYYTDKDKFPAEAQALMDDWYKLGREKTGDMRMESNLRDDEPRTVSGVKGVNSTRFSKRFPNAAAMNRWLDGEGSSGDYEIYEIARS